MREKVKLTFVNKLGETLTLIYNKEDEIVFNHSDIHVEDEYENISMLNEYVLNEEEMIAIDYFCKMISAIY